MPTLQRPASHYGCLHAEAAGQALCMQPHLKSVMDSSPDWQILSRRWKASSRSSRRSMSYLLRMGRGISACALTHTALPRSKGGSPERGGSARDEEVGAHQLLHEVPAHMQRLGSGPREQSAAKSTEDCGQAKHRVWWLSCSRMCCRASTSKLALPALPSACPFDTSKWPCSITMRRCAVPSICVPLLMLLLLKKLGAITASQCTIVAITFQYGAQPSQCQAFLLNPDQG